MANKKNEVLGVRIISKEGSVKKIKPKISPPVLSFELADKKYPNLKPFERPTLTSSPTPTVTPTPTIPVSNNSAEESLGSSLRIGAIAQSVNIVSSSPLIKQINDFRVSRGMAPVSENTETCAFASTRANEIISNFNHDGFTSRANSNSLPYPTYSSVAENIAMNSDANKVVPGWINSPGHNENLSKDVPYGCVRNNGDYYAFEAWKP